MKLIALDFDGVLCDSAAETAESAWRAGRALYPEWASASIPAAHVQAFRRVRPVLETGFEAIPLLRLVDRGISEARIFADFASLRDEVIAASGATREELVDLFGAARDRWIREDLASWLTRHRFYPGTIERVRERLAADTVFILTTKQERFVRELLAPVLPEFPQARIFGLESGRSKTDLLTEFAADPQWRDRPIHFVEDRLRTLRQVCECRKLDAVHLHLAAWGYARPEDIEEARASERLSVWQLDQFLQFSGYGP